MYVKHIDHMGSDHTVTQAARISFNKSTEELTDRDKKLIDYLADHEHMTPFEAITLTLEVKCPLYIRSQIMRHRTFSYSEVSRRYTSDEIEFYVPQMWRKQASNNKQASEGILEYPGQQEAEAIYCAAVAETERVYSRLIEIGVSREMARSVLPQSLYTKFWMTGNLRNWVHFCKLRLDSHAQQEAQVIAQGVKKILDEKFPVSTAALFK